MGFTGESTVVCLSVLSMLLMHNADTLWVTLNKHATSHRHPMNIMYSSWLFFVFAKNSRRATWMDF